MWRQVKIDLITHDAANDEFVLYLVEDGPWPDSKSEWRECLLKIQNRIFDAIDVAVEGHLAVKYPESSGKKIRVQIDSPHGVPPHLKELVFKIRQYLESEQGRSAVAQSRFIKGLRVVLGHELGRFRTSSVRKHGNP